MSTEIENNSGMIRFAVPLLLLAALLLGTMKFCSEQAKSRVVAEERSVLQQELASAQQELTSTQKELTNAQQELANAQNQADISTAKIGSLESEYSSAQAAAQADKEQLQSDLQSAKAELEELRDVPTDTAELQQRLFKVTAERYEALEKSALAALLTEQTKDELVQANSTISSLNRQKTAAINQIGSLAQLGEQTKEDLV